jgi:hypothetical protein
MPASPTASGAGMFEGDLQDVQDRWIVIDDQ